MPLARQVSRPTLRLGLIGAGGYGARHLQTMDFLPPKPEARLVAVADPFREKYPLLEDRLSAKGVRWHLTMEQMLAEEELNAVVIAAPIPRHFAMAKLALKSGLHVYLEKPPVPLIQQLDELIALDRERKVAVGFQLIHSQPIQRLKQLIEEGALGEILSIRGGASAPRRRSYYGRASWAGKMSLQGEPVFDGPMTNALAHILQNIMYLGAPGENAYAKPVELRGELYRTAAIESYDSACVRGTLDSGVAFAFAGTHASAEILPHTLEIRGTKATVRMEGERLHSTAALPLEHPGEAMPPLESSYLNFLRYVSGAEDALTVSLEDTRGYTLATNGTLASSGGIHSINESYSQAYEINGDPGVDTATILPLVRRCVETGALFSDGGPGWAVRSEAVEVAGLRGMALEEWGVLQMPTPLEATLQGG